MARVTRGRTLLKPNEVIVGADFDATGTTLLITASASSHATASAPDILHVVGVFQTGDPQADRELFADLDGRAICWRCLASVNAIAVHADTVRNAVMLADEIRAAFTGSHPAIDVLLARDAVKQLDNTLGTVQLFLLAISLIAAVGGGMSIAVSMIMSVMERRAEFGVLKAVGWSNLNITGGVLIESTIIGCIGAPAGWCWAPSPWPCSPPMWRASR